ncbi:HAD-IA family hydrolase [Aestuariispira insulae]|uniref:Phosphoglycolate phosphatase n=1 Tax=Aestuariispira insulae TaxID=1461337 RepID=A0A3D9HSN0_9PROT|nr:HAD-IA family hydrolase [Aestuariispira insulae]RED52512.1 phosphoglycolate phosphatase [Aestuariispira insulae]
MALSTLRFVVFDCDGTLVDSQYGIFAAMAFAFEQAGLPAPARADVTAQVGLPLEEGVANMLPGESADLHRKIGHDFHAAIYEHKLPATRQARLFPHCRKILHTLNDEGYVLGIATGMGRRGLERTLGEQDLEGLFTVTKTADDGPGKPNPAILQDAIAEVGADPKDTVMIGDTVFDIQTAVNARTLAIGVDWGYHGTDALKRAGARMVVSDFREIPDCLEKIWVG